MNRRGFFGLLAGALLGTRGAATGPVYGGNKGYWIGGAPTGWRAALDRGFMSPDQVRALEHASADIVREVALR